MVVGPAIQHLEHVGMKLTNLLGTQAHDRPELVQLCLVLKQLLSQQDMNEVADGCHVHGL